MREVLGATVALSCTAAAGFIAVSIYLWHQASLFRRGAGYSWLAVGSTAGVLLSISVGLLAFVLLRRAQQMTGPGSA